MSQKVLGEELTLHGVIRCVARVGEPASGDGQSSVKAATTRFGQTAPQPTRRYNIYSW